MSDELTLQNLVIMLNTRCVPYCCWEAEDVGNGEARRIAPELLRRGIEFAARHQLALTFVEGDEPPSPELEALIQSVAHTRIVPFARHGGGSRERIVVMDAADLPAAAAEPALFLPHVIVRLGVDSVADLSTALGGIHGKYGRLNLCPRALERWSEDDLTRYGAELRKFAAGLRQRIGTWWHPEVNVLTDRMVLRGMNNCDAGLRQVTLAPNGRFYPCPAFAMDPENPTGDPEEGIKLKNGHLLTLEYAPLCRRCDAFHCRRCVYLNRRLTGEINTPSRQQCLAAHEEREAARQMLDRMLDSGMVRDPHACSPIPPLDFRDPFDLFNREDHIRVPLGPASPASADTEALLREILAVQREILEQVKMINQKLQQETEKP